MKYASSIFTGLKVMAKVKVFVYAANADADADGRAMTLAPRTFVPAKKFAHSGTRTYYLLLTRLAL